jgi:hypothetical protein
VRFLAAFGGSLVLAISRPDPMLPVIRQQWMYQGVTGAI